MSAVGKTLLMHMFAAIKIMQTNFMPKKCAGFELAVK